MATQSPAHIFAMPAVGQLIEYDGKTYETIIEGRAYILVPPNTQKTVDPKAKAKAADAGGGEAPQNVFYNPIQQFNRDLSVLAIRAFGGGLCERRRARHERDSAKTEAKRERKKRRKAEAREREGGDEVEREEVRMRKRKADELEEGDRVDERGAKLMKTQDGSAKAAGETVVDGQERQRQVTEGPREHNMDADVGVAVEQTQMATAQNGGDMDMVQSASAPMTAIGDDDGSRTPAHDAPPQPWKPKFRILDALSATGLRALRYASEIPFATAITANDMDRNAVKSIRMNVEHNKLSDKVNVNLGNAIGYMYSTAYPPPGSHGPQHVSGKYDVIDLDPYGTAAMFIDSALQALNDGGLLCVTCTDSGVFASCGYAEKTYALYGGMPVKGPHSHEGGLRLIINSVASSAAKYGLAIEPLLSLSIDFYARLFIRVSKSPADVKFLAGKTMLTYDCDAGCGAWYTQMLGRNIRQTGKEGKPSQEKNPTFNFKHSIAQAPSTDRYCEHCGSKMHVAGPMWGGPLHNAAFVEKLLTDVEAADKDVYQTKPRLEGMLDTALNELQVIPDAEVVWQSTKREDASQELLVKTPPETVDLSPFFFNPSALAKVIHCIAPPEAAIKGALRHAGYRATRSHCKPGSIKTDAPWTAIWETMREWVRQKKPIKEGAVREGQPGWKIMQAAREPEEETNGHAATEEEGNKSDESATIITQTECKAAKGSPPADPKRMKVVFDEVLGRDKPGSKRLVRYQQNPRENWGPMSRAKGSG